MKTLKYELTVIVKDSIEHGEVTGAIDRAFNQRWTFQEVLPGATVDFVLISAETEDE